MYLAKQTLLPSAPHKPNQNPNKNLRNTTTSSVFHHKPQRTIKALFEEIRGLFLVQCF